MSWEKTEIDLGNIKVGKKQKIIFKAIKELPLIKSLHSSCGCSTPNFNKKTKELVVSYNPNNVPNHLKAQGWYNTRKTITIIYVDGSKEVLSFTAKIYK